METIPNCAIAGPGHIPKVETAIPFGCGGTTLPAEQLPATSSRHTAAAKIREYHENGDSVFYMMDSHTHHLNRKELICPMLFEHPELLRNVDPRRALKPV